MGLAHQFSACDLSLTENPRATPALVLLCVKSAATIEAASVLGKLLPQGTLVLSLQNGVGSATVAAQVAPTLQVVPGMVGFNVAEVPAGHWHRGTDGYIAAHAHAGFQAVRSAYATY